MHCVKHNNWKPVAIATHQACSISIIMGEASDLFYHNYFLGRLTTITQDMDGGWRQQYTRGKIKNSSDLGGVGFPWVLLQWIRRKIW